MEDDASAGAIGRPVDFEKLFVTAAGEDLPTDSATDDRVDEALKARSESYKQADDLNWLLERTAAAGRLMGLDPLEETEPASAASRGWGWRKAGPNDWPVDSETGEPLGLLAASAYDLNRAGADLMPGLIEAPRQAFGGMRDAVQSIIDLEKAFSLASRLERRFPLGGVTFTDEEGNFSLDYKSPEEWRALTEGAKVTEPELPQVGAPRTVEGAVVRSVTQFLR
jgi:hypothetical protein